MLATGGEPFSIMKRFTETTKWDDKWFRKLPPEAKLFWDWICSKCDQAGVIEPDFDLAAFQIGMPVTDSVMDHFEGRIERLENGKLHIVKFVQFQYGKLSRQCKPHQPVFAALERHGIDPDGVKQNDAFKESVDESLRQKVIERDGLFCVYYGKAIAEHEAVIDHIIPRSRGGQATMENLVVASFRANSKKWDYSPEQFCEAAGLDKEVVFKRLSNATGKPSNAFYDSENTLLGRVKEKEKEKEKEKDQVKEAPKKRQRNEKQEIDPTKAKGTLQELEAYALELGLQKSDATSTFHKWEGNGWTNGNRPIRDWRATFRSWESAKYFPSQKASPASTQPASGPRCFPGEKPSSRPFDWRELVK